MIERRRARASDCISRATRRATGCLSAANRIINRPALVVGFHLIDGLVARAQAPGESPPAKGVFRALEHTPSRRRELIGRRGAQVGGRGLAFCCEPRCRSARARQPSTRQPINWHLGRFARATRAPATPTRAGSSCVRRRASNCLCAASILCEWTRSESIEWHRVRLASTRVRCRVWTLDSRSASAGNANPIDFYNSSPGAKVRRDPRARRPIAEMRVGVAAQVAELNEQPSRVHIASHHHFSPLLFADKGRG